MKLKSYLNAKRWAFQGVSPQFKLTLMNGNASLLEDEIILENKCVGGIIVLRE